MSRGAIVVLLGLLLVPAGARASVVDGPGAPADVAVIVELDHAVSPARVRALSVRTGLTAEHRFPRLSMLSGRVPSDRLALLERAPGVAHVERDGPIALFDASAEASFGITEARRDIPGLDGSGTTAAVIDTGIDAGHHDLDGGKVKAFVSCVPAPPCHEAPPSDQSTGIGHGTHVAATLAGDHGVAPGASLVDVQVLDANGGPMTGGKERMIAGIEWVLANRETYGIDVINLSVGIPADGPLGEGCSDGQDPLSQWANAAVDAGILVVAAAGNSEPGTCTVGSPAAAEKVVTVGSMADLDDAGLVEGRPVLGFRLARYSGRGPTNDGRTKPDVMAPGVEITSAEAGTTDGAWDGTGTSAAAPFVSGLGLLMHAANPALTPEQLKTSMMGTAVDWGPPGPDNDYGAGRLDAYAALAAVGAAPLVTPPPVPMHQAFAGSLDGIGDTDTYALPDTDGAFPLAATLIVPDGTAASGSTNFDLELKDPTGVPVANATTMPGSGTPPASGRQETLGYRPVKQGTYTLVVRSVAGSGAYRLDVSRSPAPPVSAGAPVIGGEPQVGAPLTATPGDWGGAAPRTFQYRWKACTAPDACAPVPGAAGPEFVPSPAEEDRTLRVEVTATNAGGEAVAVSAPTAAVAPGAMALQAGPVVSGTARVAEQLTAAPGQWAPAAEESALQWLRCDVDGDGCSPIGGGTEATYELRPADAGRTVRVRERVGAAGYADGEAVSAPSDVVAAGAMAVTSAPVLSGTARVGERLTVEGARWTPAAEWSSLQWLRCDAAGDGCSAIGRATGTSYELGAGDAGYTVRVRDSGGAAGYADGVAESAPSGVVQDAPSVPPTDVVTDVRPPVAGFDPFVLEVAPTIAGTAAVGGRLVATPGRWRPGAEQSTLQWLHCSRAGTDCQPIAGASGPVLLVGVAEAGAAVRVSESVAAAGRPAATATSLATPVARGLRLAGGQGNDNLRGGVGDDKLTGRGGRDRLRGSAGDDRLDGGAGNDVLDGGAGRDVLTGGAGRDRIRCGPGRDTVLAARGDKVAADCERVRG